MGSYSLSHLSSPWSLTFGGYLFWFFLLTYGGRTKWISREEGKERGKGNEGAAFLQSETHSCGPWTCSHLCNSGTVSTLCAYTSKPDRATFSTALRSPRKSGVRHSTRIFGFLEGKKISPEWKKRTNGTAAYTAVPAGPGWPQQPLSPAKEGLGTP